LVTIFGWILQNYAQKILDFVPVLKNYCNDQHDCFSALSVDRLMFGFSMFHLFLGLLMIGVKSSSDPRMSIQDGFWPIKFLLLAGMIVGSFFIPNEFFVYYDWIAFSGAIIFILIQLILLLDFAHSWSENWTDKLKKREIESDGTNGWLYALLFATFTMYAITLTMDILLYVYFASGSDCKLNAFFVTMTMLVCILFSLASISPYIQERNPKASLLPSSIVTFYATYLVWSAIMSEPTDNVCNGWKTSAATNVSILMGAAITLVAVSYSTIKAAMSHKDLMGTSSSSAAGKTTEALLADEKEKAKEVKKEEDEDEDDQGIEDDEKEGPTYNYTFFHFVFLLGAMYMSELISNWSVIKQDDNNNIAVDTGMVSVWMKIASGWVVMLLYIWTLIAPILFPDREW